MACGCPAWKTYVNTEEVCDLPVLDGSIYFLVGEDEELAVTSYNLSTDTYQILNEDPLVEGEVTMPDPCVFDTTLPTPELGEWRYEYTGTFTPDLVTYPDLESIADCVITELVEDAGVFHWECEVLNPIVDYETEGVQILCPGDPPEYASYTIQFDRQLWEGVLDIYYTLLGVEYGPITVNAIVPRVQGLECY